MLCIGVGNLFRADDAAGLLTARALQSRRLPGVRVIESTGDLSDFLSAWAAYEFVIVIDAVSSGRPPGHIHRLETHTAPLPVRPFTSSSHGFGVAEAIEIGRALGQLPGHLIIYGIEGGDFTLGNSVTPAVADAIARLVECIATDVQAFQRDLSGPISPAHC